MSRHRPLAATGSVCAFSLMASAFSAPQRAPLDPSPSESASTDTAAAAPEHPSAQPPAASPAVLFIAGGLTEERNFTPYFEAAREAGLSARTETVDIDPFRANHITTLARIRATKDGILTQGADGLIVFAFSIGAKFAAKLALEDTRVRGLFLLDPNDGPPPLFGDLEKFPVFLADPSKLITAHTVILRSEFGGSPGFLGIPCVSAQWGPAHFRSRTQTDRLRELPMTGASHTDFLMGPLPFAMRFSCARGSADGGDVLRESVSHWKEFLDGET